MSSLEHRAREAAHRFEPRWDHERAAAVKTAIVRRRQRRRRLERVGYATALGAALVLLWLSRGDAGRPPPVASSAAPAPAKTALTAPPSAAADLATLPPVVVVAGEQARQVGDDWLVPAGARYVIVLSNEPVSLRLGDQRITSTRAVFAVDDRPGHASLVLQFGEVLSRRDEPATTDSKSPERDLGASEGRRAPDTAPAAQKRSETPAALLARIDELRDQKDFTTAAAEMQRFVERHPASAQAPAIAHARARILSLELGRPAEAMNAYRRAYELRPDGPLAEPALARAIESALAAGHEATARKLARLYHSRFPDGRWREVFAGLTK